MKRYLLGIMSVFLVGCSALQPTQQIYSGAEHSESDVAGYERWPDQVKESSGLAYGLGLLWTINDSGDGPFLYAIDNQHQVSRVIRIEGADNIDWEELAQDERYLYIADCGNNRGDRSRLQIYKVRWSQLKGVKSGESVPSEKIAFSYADRVGQINSSAHNFDCEALTVVNGKLWLFTKNRGDLQTNLYILETDKWRQQITAVASYPVEGLITAADFDPQKRRLVLLGYRRGVILGESFIWTMPVDVLPRWDQAKKIVLKPFAQWEAVLWDTSSPVAKLLLTSEKNPLLDVGIGSLIVTDK